MKFFINQEQLVQVSLFFLCQLYFGGNKNELILRFFSCRNNFLCLLWYFGKTQSTVQISTASDRFFLTWLQREPSISIWLDLKCNIETKRCKGNPMPAHWGYLERINRLGWTAVYCYSVITVVFHPVQRNGGKQQDDLKYIEIF